MRLHKAATCPHTTAAHGAVVDREGSTDKPAYYIVMERLAGNLRALALRPGGVHADADMRTRLPLLADVADALAYLQAGGVRHADVKPDSVLLTTPTGTAPRAKLRGSGAS